MNRKYANLLITSAFLVAVYLLGAPNTPRKPTIKWAPAPDAYTQIYTRTNLTTGDWVFVVQLPPGVGSWVITNTPGIHFFALTASNMWGESSFSETVQSSSKPQPPIPSIE